MNTTERHFHHFGQVLHRRKRLLSKCIKIRVTRWSSLWSLVFHPSLGTIIFLNQDNELISANLAVTVGVTGTEESLGLGVVQDACT